MKRSIKPLFIGAVRRTYDVGNAEIGDHPAEVLRRVVGAFVRLDLLGHAPGEKATPDQRRDRGRLRGGRDQHLRAPRPDVDRRDQGVTLAVGAHDIGGGAVELPDLVELVHVLVGLAEGRHEFRAVAVRVGDRGDLETVRGQELPDPAPDLRDAQRRPVRMVGRDHAQDLLRGDVRPAVADQRLDRVADRGIGVDASCPPAATGEQRRGAAGEIEAAPALQRVPGDRGDQGAGLGGDRDFAGAVEGGELLRRRDQGELPVLPPAVELGGQLGPGVGQRAAAAIGKDGGGRTFGRGRSRDAALRRRRVRRHLPALGSQGGLRLRREGGFEPFENLARAPGGLAAPPPPPGAVVLDRPRPVRHPRQPDQVARAVPALRHAPPPMRTGPAPR